MAKDKVTIFYPETGTETVTKCTVYKNPPSANSCWLHRQSISTGYSYRKEFATGPTQGDHSSPEAYDAEYTSVTAIPGSLHGFVQNSTHSYELVGTGEVYPAGWADNAFHLGSKRANMHNLALAKLRARLRDHANDYGTFAGELPSAVKEMLPLVRDAVKAANQVKKGQFSKAVETLAGNSKGARRKSFRENAARATARGQIAYAWGISPMAEDLYKAQESVKDAYSLQSRYVTAEVDTVATIKPWDYYDSVDVKVGAKAGCFVHIYDANLAALSALGLTNPLNVAWNVASMSFIIDWLVPIGDILANLSVAHGAHISRAYVTTYTKTDGILEGIPCEERHGPGFSGTPPKLRVSSTVMSRSVYDGFPDVKLILTLDNLTLGKIHSLVNLVKLLEN